MERESFEWTDQQFYDGLRDAQEYVLNEMALMSFTQNVNGRNESQIQEAYKTKQMRMKQYWTYQLMYELNSIKKGRVNAETGAFKAISADPVFNGEFVPKGEPAVWKRKFLELGTKELPKDGEAIYMFSAIPSFFKFFSTASAVNEFIDWVTRCAPEYVMIVFYTPAFVRFIKKTVSPVLEEYMKAGSECEIIPERILSDIQRNWATEVEELPLWIRKVLEGKDVFFVKFFQTQFLKDPQRFLGYNVFKKLDKEKLEHHLKNIDVKGLWETLKPNGIRDMKTCRRVISEVGESALVKVRDYTIYSSFDKQLFDSYLPTPKTEKSFQADCNTLEFYRSSFTKGTKMPDGTTSDLTQTQRGDDIAHYALRQMLKYAPVLPKRTYETKCDNVIGMIKELLVDTAMIPNIPIITQFFQEFQQACPKRFVDANYIRDSEGLQDYFERMKLSHHIQMQQLSAKYTAHDEMRACFDIVNDAIMDFFHYLQCTVVDEHRSTKRKGKETELKPMSAAEIVTNPVMFKKYLDSRRESSLMCNPIVHYNIEARDVSLRTYMRHNQHIKLVSNIVHSYLKKDQPVDDAIESFSTGYEFRNCCQCLQTVCMSDKGPYEKLIDLGHVLKRLNIAMKSELGYVRDHEGEIRKHFFRRANPPNLTGNIAFITDMILDTTMLTPEMVETRNTYLQFLRYVLSQTRVPISKVLLSCHRTYTVLIHPKNEMAEATAIALSGVNQKMDTFNFDCERDERVYHFNTYYRSEQTRDQLQKIDVIIHHHVPGMFNTVNIPSDANRQLVIVICNSKKDKVKIQEKTSSDNRIRVITTNEDPRNVLLEAISAKTLV